MASSDPTPVRFGIVGSGMITRGHLAAFRQIRSGFVGALADYPRDRGGRPGRGEALAREFGVPSYHPDYRRMLEQKDVEAVLITLPNAQHAEVALAGLAAGKHVLIEKPLCLRLEDADQIVALAKKNGLVAGYAEELPYAPLFVRGKELVDKGALGRLFLLRQHEIHAGPYSDWFFDPDLSGGGALMDMGCHAIEYARWMFDKRPVQRVTAQINTYVHQARRTSRGLVDDHCLVHLDFEGGVSAILEAGWTLQGGMDSKATLQGTSGSLHLDLLKETGLRLFSLGGAPGEDLMPGWSTPEHDSLWQNGYPQELDDFACAIREQRTPKESAADGRAVLEIIWAAYASAREGKSVSLPYAPPAGYPTPLHLFMEKAR